MAGGKGLAEIEVKSYTRSIIKGLIHIHKNNYVHCDLKPANILLVRRNDSRFIAKIGDLGLARRTSRRTQQAGYYHCTLGGTLSYMAPETLIHNVQESPSDVWALGCLVLEMLTGNRPWTAGDKREIVKEINEMYIMPKIPEGVSISIEARDFLKSCFVKNPKFRFTAEMLMYMPFVAAASAEEEENFITAIVEKRSCKRQRIIPIQAV